MDIEAELPDDFENLSNESKVEELQKLKEKLGSDQTDILKERMIEELIRNYKED